MSKVRTSASKKINLMELIRTLTISTTTFERIKKKFDGFQQTDLTDLTTRVHTRLGVLKQNPLSRVVRAFYSLLQSGIGILILATSDNKQKQSVFLSCSLKWQAIIMIILIREITDALS